MPYLVNGQLVPEELIREEFGRISRDPQWQSIPDLTERAHRLRAAAVPDELMLKSLDDPGQLYTGAKLAVYAKWQKGTTRLDSSVPEQGEFYDYTNLLNRAELGNDYLRLSQYPNSLTLFNNMTAALATPSTGLLYTQLWAALQGSYPNDPNRYPGRAGVALSSVMSSALAGYRTLIGQILTRAPQNCSS